MKEKYNYLIDKEKNLSLIAKKFIFMIFLFVYMLAAATGFAQNVNYKNGYIITNRGDTVFGQIDVRTNMINQSQCRFRTDEKSQPVVYKPFDITSYYCTDDGLYYISKTIEIDSVKINTFVEFLVNGIMNLYYYEYKTDKYSDGSYYQYEGVVEYYFFEDETGKMYAVDKKPDKILSDNLTKSDYLYRDITSYILRDAPNISRNIKNMQFNQKSFIEITKIYHNAVCTDRQKCIVYQNPNPDKLGYIVLISPFIGYNFCNYAYIYEFTTTSGEKYHSSLDVNTPSPTIGAELKIVNPRSNQFLGMQVELSVSQLKIPTTTGTIKVDLPHDNYYTIPVDINAHNSLYGKFKVGIIGFYPKNKIQPIVGYGVYASKLFGANNKNMDLGGSLTVGIDYVLNARHHLIFRVNYDQLFFRASDNLTLTDSSRQVGYTDTVNSIYSIKIGYSF